MVALPEEESSPSPLPREEQIPEQITITPQSPLPEEFSEHPPLSKNEPPIPEAPPVQPNPTIDAPSRLTNVSEEYADEAEDDFDDDETPLYLTPLFLFGIGSVIALLLAILLVLFLKKLPPQEEPPQTPPAATQVTTPLPTPVDPSPEEPTVSERIDPFEEEVPNDLLSNENFDSQGSGLTDENYGENAQKEEDEEPIDDSLIEEENSEDSSSNEEKLPPEEVEEVPSETAPAPSESAPKESSSVEEELPIETLNEEPTIEVPTELDQNLSVKIDISQRLAISIPSIRLPSRTLPELVTILQGITGVPISIDWNSLESAPALCSGAVPVSFNQITAGDLLQEIARVFQLTVTIEEDQIVLSRPKSPFQTKRIDISDIIAPSSLSTAEEETLPFLRRTLPAQITEEALLAFLKDLLRVAPANDPNSLEDLPNNEKTPSLTIENGILIAEGDTPFLAQTERLLAQLRQVRQLEQPNPLPPEELIPETIGYEKLEEPISLNFIKPVTLNESIPLLARKEKIHYLLDLAAITRAGISLDTRIQFHSESLPAEQILTELTAGYRLSWFMPTADLIVITTKEELLRYPSIEILFYAAPKDGEIQKKIDDETAFFIEKGMSLLEATGGTLWIDPTSGCLFVRADAATRRAVRWKETGTPKAENQEENSSIE